MLIPTAAKAATLTVPTISISISTCKISTRCFSAAGKASERTFLVSGEIIFEKIVLPLALYL
jgi:hypothetical protein